MIMGERFPEYDEWESARKTEREEHRQRIEELEDDPAALLKFALEKLKHEKLKQQSPSSTQPNPNPPIPIQDIRKVGRNAPCPCGSGKKFKKCCINSSLR
ncbi:SEC-C metal-binding domain-containing protein [Planctomycetota bacterium]